MGYIFFRLSVWSNTFSIINKMDRLDQVVVQALLLTLDYVGTAIDDGDAV